MAARAWAFLIIIVVTIRTSAYAGTQHVVGGSTGWTNSGTYTSWTASQAFSVGDTLLFNYDNSIHSVAQVPKSGYDGCTAANAINSYNDGNTVIPLTTVGSMYFICQTIGHCAGGMKLAVNVVAASTTTTNSSSPSPLASTTIPSSNTVSTPPKSGVANTLIIILSCLALCFL